MFLFVFAFFCQRMALSILRRWLKDDLGIVRGVSSKSIEEHLRSAARSTLCKLNENCLRRINLGQKPEWWTAATSTAIYDGAAVHHSGFCPKLIRLKQFSFSLHSVERAADLRCSSIDLEETPRTMPRSSFSHRRRMLSAIR
jgi:hypothetical protein